MNTLKNLRRNLRLRDLPAKVRRRTGRVEPLPPRRPDRSKPAQPTILRHSTARRLVYLVERGLTPSFDDSNFVIARRTYRRRDPITGQITSEKINDESPTCGV